MVPGSSLSRIPKFCKRGSAKLKLETVTWNLAVIVHPVHHFIQSISRQCLKQVAVSNISGGEPVSVCLDTFDQVLDNCLLLLRIDQSCKERDGIGCLASGSVLSGSLIEKCVVISALNIFPETGIVCQILFPPCHLCRLCQVIDYHIIVGGCR